MYYLGFLKQNTKDVVVFKSWKRPKRGDFSYFVRVMGPYTTEVLARKGLIQLKEAYGEYGYRENPSPVSRVRFRKKGMICGKDHVHGGRCSVRKLIKNVMSPEKVLRLTRKVYRYAKDVYKDYQENPGQSYHDQKFLGYMKELEKYKLGSVPYIGTLAKAYEHLESAKESMR